MQIKDTKECFASHMGIYAVEPHAFRSIVAQVQARMAEERPVDSQVAPQAQVEGTVAVVPIHGSITKKRSKFSQNSAIELRSLMRQLGNDDTVSKVILHIDSPGGAVEGIDDLASEIKAVSARKPVVAYIEDLGASAAYWLASQCNEIVANRGAFVGSLGVYGVIQDWSKSYEREGVKVHVVSSGGVKGAGVEGTEITESMLADEQRIVDAITANFQRAVYEGRNMSRKAVGDLFDGRVHPAEEALRLGLIDRVGTFESILGGNLMPNEELSLAEAEALLGTEVQAAAKAMPMEKEEEEEEKEEEKAEFPPAEDEEDEEDKEEDANKALAQDLIGQLRSAGCPLSEGTLKAQFATVSGLDAMLALYDKLAKVQAPKKAATVTSPKTAQRGLNEFEEDKRTSSTATNAKAEFERLFNAELGTVKGASEQEKRANALLNVIKKHPDAHAALLEAANRKG